MTDYFVATTGSDTTGDGSEGNPWATPNGSTNKVTGGDTVYVLEGVYTDTDSDSYVFKNWDSGTEGSPIIYSAVGNAVIDGGGTAQFGIACIGTSWVEFHGFEVRNTTFNGISASGANITCDSIHLHHNGNVIVSDCDDGYGRVGLYISAQNHNLTVRNCVIHDNGRIPNLSCDELLGTATHNYRHDHGLYLQGKGHLIENNVFYNHPAGYAIKVDGFWGDALVEGEFTHIIQNNSFGPLARPDDAGGGVIRPFNNGTYDETYGTMKDPRALFANNLFVSPNGPAADTAIRVDTLANYSGMVALNNITSSVYLYGEDAGASVTDNWTETDNIKNTDPLVAGSENNNYKLTALSQAISAGTPSYAPMYDIIGIERGTPPDIGAYEFVVNNGARLRIGIYPP